MERVWVWHWGTEVAEPRVISLLNPVVQKKDTVLSNVTNPSPLSLSSFCNRMVSQPSRGHL